MILNTFEASLKLYIKPQIKNKKKKPYLQLSTQSKKRQTNKAITKSFRKILSAGGRYPSGILFCVNFCYPSTTLCDSMLTNRQLSTKSVPMLLAQSGDAYNFPSHLFFRPLPNSYYLFSHWVMLIFASTISAGETWVLEDEGFEVKTTKVHNSLQFELQAINPTVFLGGFFWRVSQLERTPSVKCYLCSWRALGNISYQQAPRSLGHSRGVCPRSDLAGEPLFQSHVSDAAPLAGRSQEAPPSPKLLPIQKHHHRWAGGY